MATNKKTKTEEKTLRSNILPAHFSNVLQQWTKFVHLESKHGIQQLVSTITGRPEYRMEIEDKLVSLEMLKSQGTNSIVYLVKTHGYTNEAILKHFKPSEARQSNSTESKSSETRLIKYYTQPKLEAKLQKYAHAKELAPEVFAFNDVAMISDKCKPLRYKRDRCYKNTYGKNYVRPTPEIRKLQRADAVLQEWFNPFTDQILILIDTMYREIGMYNMDPNEGNYMLNQTDTLIQIDYGANRFDKQQDFDDFTEALGLVKKTSNMYLSLKKQLLLKDQPTYPPYFYWFTQDPVDDTTMREIGITLPPENRLHEMGKQEWDQLFGRLRKQKEDICNKLKISQKPAVFKTFKR